MKIDRFSVLRVENESEVSALGDGVAVLLRASEGDGVLLLLGPTSASPPTSGALLWLMAGALNAERRVRGALGCRRALAEAEQESKSRDSDLLARAEVDAEAREALAREAPSKG